MNNCQLDMLPAQRKPRYNVTAVTVCEENDHYYKETRNYSEVCVRL